MPASFWIFLIICIASFVVAIDDHGAEWNEFKESTGRKKWWKGLKIFTLWFVCLGSFFGTLVLGHESKQSDAQYGEVTNQLALVTSEYNQATNALVTISNRGVNEVIKLKNPSVITSEQREKFIAILSNSNNVSKVRIDVIMGKGDRETERFAFQVRKLLDEAGYGGTNFVKDLPFETQTNSWNFVTVPAHIQLPPFAWEDANVGVNRNVDVSPLPCDPITNMDTTAIASSFDPFTDKEPNIIALFPGPIKPFDFSVPSVMIMHPGQNYPFRASTFAYFPIKNPNAILFGVCAAFNEIGITVGKNKIDGILPPDHIAIFIPNR